MEQGHFTKGTKGEGQLSQGGILGIGNNSGNNLKYTDYKISSYSGIFDNDLENKNKDKKRVIIAEKNCLRVKNLKIILM